MDSASKRLMLQTLKNEGLVWERVIIIFIVCATFISSLPKCVQLDKYKKVSFGTEWTLFHILSPALCTILVVQSGGRALRNLFTAAANHVTPSRRRKA